jgi:aspartate/methionine/tyrosine aminotransferase
MRRKYSEYMYWAKTQSQARFNLATSGVGSFPLRELNFNAGDFEIHGDNSYGYQPLLNSIAAKCGTSPDCVVTAAGTSMANHLAMAALLEPGDEVLIEDPTYELIVSAAEYLGASVKRFVRREENGYAIDPAELRRAVTPKTRLIVLTNLHNPSSVLTSEEVLREVGSIGPTVLVDEVYLDAVHEHTPRSSFHLGPNFVVTNSLTKVYGLSGLRCGWILAQPDLSRAIWRLNDVFAATPVQPGELLSVVAFRQLDAIRQRARRVVEADRALLGEFLRNNTCLSAPETHFGTTAFIRLLGCGIDDFLARLRTEYETSAVPGRFFGMTNHFRVGMGVNTTMFAEGLANIEKLCGSISANNAVKTFTLKSR